MRLTWCLILYLVGVVSSIEHDFKGFDDSIIFGINWPGSDSLDNIVDGDVSETHEINNDSNKEIHKVTTVNQEKYECRLPEIRTRVSSNIEDYDGPTPFNLLKPLFQQKICSYRLESYWSYEVCHGRYIRQYHEEREGKQVKTQEYFLGHWDAEKQLKTESDANSIMENTNENALKTTKVEGLTVPYVQLVMDGGTLCDLSGKPRLTRVLYVCYTHGKHEIYSFKEISTCEYEIIILSPLLCEHPHFKPKEVIENIIDCIPLDGAPKKPRSMLLSEAESLKFHQQSIRLMSKNEKDPQDVLAVLKVEKIEKKWDKEGKPISPQKLGNYHKFAAVNDVEGRYTLCVYADGHTQLQFEVHPLSQPPPAPTPSPEQAQLEQEQMKALKKLLANTPPFIGAETPVKAFLNGDNCLNGGAGWWKYEFCYGKHVMQYHIDRTGEKTSLLLGKFDDEAHFDWIRENPEKVPKPVDQRKSISHYYSGGDICDKTGKPRETEVKLKCIRNSSSPGQVTLYLLEPRTCNYILGVESPLICDILPLADQYGMIKQPKMYLPSEEHKEKPKEKESEQKAPPKFGND